MPHVIISRNGKKVFHRPGCPYVTRTRPENRVDLLIQDAEERGFVPCSYCGGIDGFFRVFHKDPRAMGYRSVVRCERYGADTFCFRTGNGFWKVLRSEENGGDLFTLYHRNRYRKNASFEELKDGVYHLQEDIRPTVYLDRLAKYIDAHDRVKVPKARKALPVKKCPEPIVYGRSKTEIKKKRKIEEKRVQSKPKHSKKPGAYGRGHAMEIRIVEEKKQNRAKTKDRRQGSKRAAVRKQILRDEYISSIEEYYMEDLRDEPSFWDSYMG